MTLLWGCAGIANSFLKHIMWLDIQFGKKNAVKLTSGHLRQGRKTLPDKTNAEKRQGIKASHKSLESVICFGALLLTIWTTEVLEAVCDTMPTHWLRTVIRTTSPVPSRVRFITALHALHVSRSSHEKAVRPSVCLSVRPSVLLSNRRQFCPDFYTTWKIIYPSFLRRRMVGGGDPFYLKFWVKLTTLKRNRRLSVDIRS